MVRALNKAAPSQCALRNTQSHPSSRDPLHYCSNGGSGLWTFIGIVPFLSTAETINISPVSPRRIRNRTSPSSVGSLQCWLLDSALVVVVPKLECTSMSTAGLEVVGSLAMEFGKTVDPGLSSRRTLRL